MMTPIIYGHAAGFKKHMAEGVAAARKAAGHIRFTGTIFLVGLAIPLLAQQSPSAVRAQHDAMTKLSFLIGNWSGPVAVSRGSSSPPNLTQSERVQFRLDGLIVTKEDTRIDASGTIVFRAFTTISYDDVAREYRSRAFSNGHYFDTKLSVLAEGLSWSYSDGSARVDSTMHLTHTGEWAEKTELTGSQNSPIRVVDMLLKRHE